MLSRLDSKFFIKILLIIVLQNGIPSVNSEFYSSISQMTKLVDIENKLLKSMDRFIEQNESKLAFLKMRLAELENEHDAAVIEGPAYFESPVNKYLMTKHLTVDWARIENLMGHKTGEKSVNKIAKYRNGTDFPNMSDFNGAIEGLLRLQEVYRLKTKDIAAGILQGVQYDTEFTAGDCFDIGLQSVTLKKLQLAHSWLMEASDRLEAGKTGKNDINPPLSRVEILIALAEVKNQLGDIKGANATYVEALELRPHSQVLIRAYMIFTLEINDKTHVDVDYSDEHEPIPDELQATRHQRYKLTCSGHFKQSPREERDLRCGYMTETHPFLLLAPLKVEEMNHDPLLVVYHEVLYDKEIEIIKELVGSRIQRATVMGINGSIVSPVRTSQFIFIPATRHPVLEKIDERVEDMTNLDMDYVEEHQFANYGIGGHYAEHHDYFDATYWKQPGRIHNAILGNRIATVLFYLTDVEQGGGTAFPFARRLLMPKKGSAAFWYNLHASGSGDKRTLHGACPIIVGSKWVQNRWIREHDQSDRRPCELYDDTLSLNI